MVYRGHVRNGRIELDDPVGLPEGAKVELNVVTSESSGEDTRSKPVDAAERTLSLEEEIDRIMADVPESEWAKLPPDLSDQLDHYIYGTPRQ